MQFVPSPGAEDQARAHLYGVLARLFYAPPDEALLQALAGLELAEGGPEGRTAQGRELAAAWRELQSACRAARVEALAEEHMTLFVGLGRSEVSPYLAAYLSAAPTDSPLARWRGQLAQWGLERRAEAPEPEDHIAGVCETMRWLIERRGASLATQRECFDTWVYPGGIRFCAAVSDCPGASFYASCARLLRAFLEVEREAFDMS